MLWAQLQDEPPDPTTGLADVAPALGAGDPARPGEGLAKRPQSAGEYARLLYEAAGLAPPASSTSS